MWVLFIPLPDHGPSLRLHRRQLFFPFFPWTRFPRNLVLLADNPSRLTSRVHNTFRFQSTRSFFPPPFSEACFPSFLSRRYPFSRTPGFLLERHLVLFYPPLFSPPSFPTPIFHLPESRPYAPHFKVCYTPYTLYLLFLGPGLEHQCAFNFPLSRTLKFLSWADLSLNPSPFPHPFFLRRRLSPNFAIPFTVPTKDFPARRNFSRARRGCFDFLSPYANDSSSFSTDCPLLSC